MSVIKRIILCIVILFSNTLLAQEKKESKRITIYLDLNDKSLREYSINKDTTGASFSIYIKKYESKKERERVTEKYHNQIDDPDSMGLSSFSVGLYVLNEKPKRIKSLKGLKFINIKQFQKSGYKTSSPTYIIHKLKDGTYLQWSAMTTEEI
ncbi:hypothetical protein [Flavobacterium sp. T12S277]|uniref:hypothetical protein n=1 Tax=Flavobacterium sp. T12S277 TaxID=3402752 RepID=UPI003ADF224A